MPNQLESITREALDLPRSQRLALVQFLLTLDGETSVNTEASWDTEIRARLNAFDEGNVEASPYEVLRQNMMLRFCR
jgi:putative addiction module component (TIGR02574 family)